jgi:hypothetical protein
MNQNTEIISALQQRQHMLKKLSEKVDQLTAIVAGVVSIGIRISKQDEIDYENQFECYTSNDPETELNSFAKLAFSLRWSINKTIEEIKNSDTENA